MDAPNRSSQPNAVQQHTMHPRRELASNQAARTSLPPNSFASLEALVLNDRCNAQPLREHTESTEDFRLGHDNGGQTTKFHKQGSRRDKTLSEMPFVTLRSEVSPHEDTPSSPSTLSPSPRKIRRVHDESRDESNRRTQPRPSKMAYVSTPRCDEPRKHRKKAHQQASGGEMKPLAAKAKSIVGSRPVHWGKTSPHIDLHSARRFGQEKRKADLSTVQAASKETRDKAQSELDPRATFDARNLFTLHKQQGSQKRSRETATELTLPHQLSFVPAFASRAKEARNESNPDTLVSGEDSVNGSESVFDDLPSRTPLVDVWQPPILVRSQDPVSSTQGRKSKGAVGPLTKRLQYLRQRANGDAIRLSSGQYPFKVKSDANDPRNRADSFCDLTVLGHPIPWEVREAQQQNQDHLALVWSYVHCSTDASTVSPEQAIADGEFVWVALPHRIAFEQSLAPGTQLRAYDATFVGLPLRPSLRNGQHGTGSLEETMQKVLLCKHLCEPYPLVLPPLLPDLSSLLKLCQEKL